MPKIWIFSCRQKIEKLRKNLDADDLQPDTRHPIAETRASITNALYR